MSELHTVAPGGDIILAGGSEGIVFFMSAQTGEKILCPLRGDKQINCIAFSPDSKILAVGDGEWFQSGNVLLYDPATGEVMSTLSGHSDR